MSFTKIQAPYKPDIKSQVSNKISQFIENNEKELLDQQEQISLLKNELQQSLEINQQQKQSNDFFQERLEQEKRKTNKLFSTIKRMQQEIDMLKRNR